MGGVMSTCKLPIVGIPLVVLLAVPAAGAPEQEMSVVSGCGGWSSNGTLRTASCAAQAGTTGVSGGGRYTHYAGFMGGAFIQPGVTNVHGTPLEADPDNDDDGLTDAAEVDGSAFGGQAVTDPNARDTDGDGMDDAAEAAGMYDPNDPGHSLRIVALDCRPAGPGNVALTLTWIGRGGGTENKVYWIGGGVPGVFPYMLYDITCDGGAAPWYKITNTYEWVEAALPNRYFRVTTSR